MPSLFYHNYGYKDQTNPSFPAVLLDKNVEPAITLHPVKTPENMYRVHGDVLQRRSRLLRHRVAVLTREMKAASAFAVSSHRSSDSRALLRDEHPDRSPTSGYFRQLRRRQFQLSSQPWETYTSKGDLYSLAQGVPRRGLPKPLQPFFRSVQWQASEILSKYAEHRGGSATQLTQLHRGFWQPPAAGEPDVRIVLDVQLSYQRNGARRSVRRQLFVRVPLGEPEVRSAFVEPDKMEAAGDGGHLASLDLAEDGLGRPPEEIASHADQQLVLVPNNVGMTDGSNLAAKQAVDQRRQVVALILPLSGRPVQLSRFLLNYERVCLRGSSSNRISAATNIHIQLLIVAFTSGDPDDDRQLSERVESLRIAHGRAAVDVVHGVGRFSRGRALQLGASRYAADDLLIFIDVDIEFDESSLRRAVEGARKGVQAFFPIVFSQYRGQLACGSPACDLDDRSEAAGFFRHYGFGIASMYKQDFDAVGGFNLTIEGWGREDVDVYDGVARSGLDVLRAPDHALVHVYHPMACGADLSAAQARMCRGSLTSQLASVRTLFDTLEKLSWSTNETSRRTVSP